MVRGVPGVVVVVLLASVAALAQQPATHVAEQAVHDIAAQLRCVVCQNLSVADSPSEMASQMRAVIRERLATGERPDQVVQYFVDKYGEWILLAPRRQGDAGHRGRGGPGDRRNPGHALDSTPALGGGCTAADGRDAGADP